MILRASETAFYRSVPKITLMDKNGRAENLALSEKSPENETIST